MRKILLAAIVLLSSLQIATSQKKENETTKLQWPKEIEKNGTVVVLYQPQLESFKGNILKGRMALSVTPKGEDIIFGALWFKARLATDLDKRTALLEKIDITKIHFPNFTDTARIVRFTGLLEKEIESWNLLMSLDRILAGLKEAEDIKKISVTLNNKPPDIYFRTEPSVLITIDGDPIIDEVKGEKFEYVVNTPFFIVKKKKKYFIKGGKFWYISDNVTQGYEHTAKVPNDIKEFAQKNLPENKLDSASAKLDKAPELIVVTKPSELVATDGKPEYAPIEGTKLLYVTNTSDDIVMEIGGQYNYVLLAGRWFRSKSLEDGDWKFVEPEELPEDFAKIPADSDMGEVRVSVPGTPEAEDALLEQTIPQTATVDRKTAKVEVKWDGKPEFEKIKNTDVQVAKNSDKTVLLIKNKYYCVDDAIWFVADSPNGPWIVSDVRPEEVNDIPPESEAYNVKYVYIYDSTPDVVYVGYLPGYTWSFAYHGCVVYGTGYWYHPWYRHYYYPRPVTWGFGVHWNPYTGWGFSFGLSYGWIGWRFHPYRGWWGPRGFYPGYRHGFYHGYRRGYYHGYRRGMANARYRQARYNNLYRQRKNGIRYAGIPANMRERDLNRKARPAARPNNVYTDRNGNIYRRDKSGKWQPIRNTRPSTGQPSTRPSTGKPGQKPSTRPTTKPTTRPATRPSTGPSTQPVKKPATRPATRPATKPSTTVSPKTRQQLNRSYQSRSRGNYNYNRSRSYSRPTRSYSRPAGGMRRR
ncbi:MAG: hypothetical protein GXO47_03650 [Chlorobi bacterium]|nr:hypothetical protein [Chlorobiota bacterium]